jgi:peptidoglycan biosynthesis protein MviN/MurJ (putative lipid II flippase)
VRLELKATGLALSTACVALTNFFLLLALMRRKTVRIEARLLLTTFLKSGLASALMSAAAYGTHTGLDMVNRYTNLFSSIAAAVVVFATACVLLRVEEFREILATIQRR